MQRKIVETMTGERKELAQVQAMNKWLAGISFILITLIANVTVTWITNGSNFATRQELNQYPPIMRMMPELETFPRRIDELENALHSIPVQLSMITASYDQIKVSMASLQAKVETLSSEVQSIKITLATQKASQ